MIRGWLRRLVLLLALAASAPALAHLTPNSEIRLRFEPGAVRADILVPAAEYRYATGHPVEDRAFLRRYLLDRTAALAPDGRRWTAELSDLRIESAPGGPDVLAAITYAPPPGAPDRRLVLLWEVVTRELDSHYALVAVSGDLARGMAEGHELVGSFTAGQRALAIDRGATGSSALLAGAFRIGAHHIVVGHDHLLFLLALLLPAPLVASRGRWGPARPLRDTVRHLFWIVTAFTVGHSATLIVAALLDARLPTAPVEALIALSVLVSAVHAMRPLFAGRESWVAFGFGLIHGLAFATVVAGFGASMAARALAILGFNLGIEAVQLLLVVLVLPGLVIVSRTRWYRAVRLGIGGFAVMAALVWLAERLGDFSSPAAPLLETVLPALGLALLTLTLLLAGWAALRRTFVQPGPDLS